MEYLLMVTFGIVVVAAAALLLNAVSSVALSARAKILSYREEAIGQLLG